MTENQNPEQKARDTIDALLEQAGWVVQHDNKTICTPGLVLQCANIKPMLALRTTCCSWTRKP